MDKKPRSDSKLDALPESRLLELRDGLLGSWSYAYELSWLATECGVSSSPSALSSFYKRHCAPVLRERKQLAAVKAEVIGEMADKTDWDKASIESLKQMVFEFMANPLADTKEIERLFSLLLRRKDQELDERKLRLVEDKAAEAKRQLEAAMSKAKAKGGLSEETLQEIEAAAGLL